MEEKTPDISKIFGVEGADEETKKRLSDKVAQTFFQELLQEAADDLEEKDIELLGDMMEKDTSMEEIITFLKVRLPNPEETFQEAARKVLEAISGKSEEPEE